MARKNRQKYHTSAKKVRILDDHPLRHTSAVDPTNLREQKDRFLKSGKTPNFIHQDVDVLEDLTNKTKNQIRFNLQAEAEYILEHVKQKFGEGENFLAQAYGSRISRVEASAIVSQYLEENLLSDSLTLIWCNDLTCSARMMWEGPMVKSNRPEARRYSLWLNGSMENPYIRQQGISCLMDHELGTHFMFNDGLQPWYSDRKKFGLRGMKSFEMMCSEEGLAAVNTALRSNVQYLWLSALVYYTACKSAEMTFKQLFDHLGRFLHNKEQRWKHVMRVKRGLADPNDLGGYGKDQCYFEGAVSILRNVENINFHLLMSGKICLDEVSRIKRIARMDCVRIPSFMKNIDSYKSKLRHIATLNGLNIQHPKRLPPLMYLARIKERKNRIGVAGFSGSRRKVRKCSKKKKPTTRMVKTKNYKVNMFLPKLSSQSSQDGDSTETSSGGTLSRDVDDSSTGSVVSQMVLRKPFNDNIIVSSLSDTQLLRGLSPFPYQLPLPPISTPREGFSVSPDKSISMVAIAPTTYHDPGTFFISNKPSWDTYVKVNSPRHCFGDSLVDGSLTSDESNSEEAEADAYDDVDGIF